MKQKRLLTMLVLLAAVVSGAWAQDPAKYKITVAEGTEDAENWTVPTEAAAGTEVTATYSGEKKVKSVKAVKKAQAVDPAKAYMKWDADQKKLVATEIPAEATMVTSSTTTWEAGGTYVVEGEVNINGTIELSGDVDLIIKDGAKLTAQQIHGDGNGDNLRIYGQANQSGQLVVGNSGTDAISELSKLEVYSAKVTATSSQDYSGGFVNISEFNVYGGSVDAENTSTDDGGYGIWLSDNGSMNIYGGDVKAVGKGNSDTSYGIAGSGSTVTVYGGKLWAECADYKALLNITLTKDTGYTSGKIEYSSDNSTWSETADADAKYVRVGY